MQVKLRFLFTLLALVGSSLAQIVLNEFKLHAGLFDDLGQHNLNCTAQMDAEVSVVYCQDGKFYVDHTKTFSNPYSVFANTAAYSFDYSSTSSPLRDVNIGADVVSVIDPTGLIFTALRKADLKRHDLALDNSMIGSNAQMLGGQFSSDFITVFIAQAGKQFIQVHRARKAV